MKVKTSPLQMQMDLTVEPKDSLDELLAQAAEEAAKDPAAEEMRERGLAATGAFQDGVASSRLKADQTGTRSLGLQNVRRALRCGHEEEFVQASTTRRDRR